MRKNDDWRKTEPQCLNYKQLQLHAQQLPGKSYSDVLPTPADAHACSTVCWPLSSKLQMVSKVPVLSFPLDGADDSMLLAALFASFAAFTTVGSEKNRACIVTCRYQHQENALIHRGRRGRERAAACSSDKTCD
jgi:hypothetical protein